jgi:hypothetical protein
MSFDLAVWHSDAPLTAREAAEVYVRLCKNLPYLEGKSDAVAIFCDELTRRWPEIDAIPYQEIDNFELCPWACNLNRSGMAVVISCVWPMANKVNAFVGELAKRHSLVLYDPQAYRVDLPDNLRDLGNEIPKR